ncbi:acyltransferase [uncultured Psychroserpens sp.]|uniref:acyltransferase family protein n=1 Tax=uncultured Psychroserpens sp. TaxID=255436 RepID=UPI0026047D21|nr:acyltransferase [uncultured Psychroserpens sp.]
MQINYEKRIFGLDLMRAIAIIMVVCSHTLWIVPDARGVIPDVLSISGVMGVEIFFVLSGFLIGRILYKMYVSKSFEFKDIFYFWVRRWFRTLPNYYLVLLLNIIIAIYLGNHLPDNVWKYFFFLHNFSTQMPWLFAESWSLSIEEFAYILGPLLLYLVLLFKTKYSRSNLFLWITLLILLIFLITKLVYNQFETIQDMRHWTINVKAIVIYRIDAIYYGVLAAYISILYANFWKKIQYGAFILGVLIFFGINIYIPMKQLFITNYPMFWNVWYFLIKSFAIVLVLPLLSQIRYAPKAVKILITHISILSYAIYLLHYSIVMQLLKYFIPSENLAGFDIFVYIVVYLLITITLSYTLYRLYEKPMTDLRDSEKIKNYFK